MKRILCALIATILMIMTATFAVSAEGNDKYENLLLLGDSITYGYGLDGNRDTCRSYGNQLREHLGVKPENFKNAAVNGDTSGDLLALLPSLGKEVKAADLIVITIGGNDMLGIIWGASAAIGGASGNIFANLNDPVYVAKFLEKITMDVITNTIIEYSVNMAGIVSYIRANNPDARVLFLAQYDPMSGLELGPLGNITAAALKMLNIQMKESAEAGGCEYVDVHTPFVGKAAEWTNMLSADIHPNQPGHDKIFEIVAEYLADTAVDSEKTETDLPVTDSTTETTTAPVEDTKAPSETVNSAPETQPPKTEVPSTEAPADGKNDKKGCRSSIAGGAGLLAALAAGSVVLKKKRNK